MQVVAAPFNAFIQLISSPETNAMQLVKPNRMGKSIALQPSSLEVLKKHMKDCVVVVGAPGVGKSTLCSGIYNRMRGDKLDYFFASNAEEGETHGLWAVKEDLKVLHAKMDRFDVLDCEGLEGLAASHYVAVSALVLAKAIVVCKGSRLDRQIIQTIKEGLALFKKLKLAVPPPVIFLQMSETPQGRAGMAVSSPQQLLKEFLASCEFPDGYDVRPFSLPRFPTGSLEDHKSARLTSPEYLASLDKLIDALAQVPNSLSVEDRVVYLSKVVDCINSTNPAMVLSVNRNIFSSKVLEIHKQAHDAEHLSIRTILEGKKVSANCNTLLEWAGRPVNFYASFTKRCEASAFYDKAFDDLIVAQRPNCFLDPQLVAGDIFKVKEAEWKKILQNIGNAMLAQLTTQLQNEVETSMLEARDQIPFQGSTSMPYSINSLYLNRRAQYLKDVYAASEGELKVSEADFQIDLASKWATHVTSVKLKWQQAISDAQWKHKITTAGDLTCPKCKKGHSAGVTHKECSKNKCKDPVLWYWIEGSGHYGICRGCHEVSHISGVCCYDDGTPLSGATVIYID